MNKQATELLDALSAKFGTTAAHLWDVLIRQVYVEAVQAAVFVAVSALMVWLSVRYLRTMPKHEYHKNEHKPTFKHIVVGVWGGLWLIGVFLQVPWIFNSLTYIFNPEYGALKLLGEALGQ